MSALQDRVALAVLDKFSSLPARYRPGLDNAFRRQWVPLSGIVLTNEDSTELDCVAVATGMKCLTESKVSAAQGLVLHDWHAEALAIRLFNHFLLGECRKLLKGEDSVLMRWRSHDDSSASSIQQPFTIKKSIKIYMYCSEAPCGDSSMELTMGQQEDPTPWKVPTGPQDEVAPEPGEVKVARMKGRGYFSELGIVRCKPGRADSPPTLSKSCSDKIAMRQITSLLSSPTSLLISPENAYIKALILPQSQYISVACDRAFSSTGRLEPVAGKEWPGNFAFRPFEVLSTAHEFEYSRRKSGPRSSNICAAWNSNVQEVLVNGILQGRKRTDPQAASKVSRGKIWHTVEQMTRDLSDGRLAEVLSAKSYVEVKGAAALEDRRRVKAEVKSSCLQGWIANVSDDFDIEADRVSTPA